MNLWILTPVAALGLAGLAYALIAPGSRQSRRLMQFADSLAPEEEERSGLLHTLDNELIRTDRLSRAGFLTDDERKRAKLLLTLAVAAFSALAFLCGLSRSLPRAFVLGSAGFYFSVTGALYYLKCRARDLERRILFDLPLCLEALILLVESGLGILPALQQVISRRDGNSPAKHTLRLVYELAAHGLPFAAALETVAEKCETKVLRHALLHLDISGTEGGELIPSLRSLSDYAHTEWRLSVERRVKRLENLVVFPVFASVIGLMFLTAAVPLVPVLELRDTIRSGTKLSSPHNVDVRQEQRRP